MERKIICVLGVAITAISVASMIGGIVSNDLLLGWGGPAGMAVNTAAALLLTGLAIIGISRELK